MNYCQKQKQKQFKYQATTAGILFIVGISALLCIRGIVYYKSMWDGKINQALKLAAGADANCGSFWNEFHATLLECNQPNVNETRIYKASFSPLESGAFELFEFSEIEYLEWVRQEQLNQERIDDLLYD